jgi:chemotaxis protein histidine kinase CheA/CheY-like chemotaxis protein
VNDRLAGSLRDLRSRTEEASVRLARVRDGAMSLAMVPVRRVLAAFPALVREVGTAVGREVELHMSGTELELDVRVLDGVADALRHLVTNAIDHGIEEASIREAAGKPPRGRVDVTARNSGSAVVIEVADDGGGIDVDALRERAIELGLLARDSVISDIAVHRVLFEPGFTSRHDVTSTSGRGVGLDVVETQVEALGGIVEVESEVGRGTRFILTVPVTLGVMRCLLVRCGDERYAIPLSGIVETIGMSDAVIHEVAGTRVLLRGDESIPVAELGAALGVVGSGDPRVLVVSRLGRDGDLAWAVDSVDGEREVVVKDLGGFLGHVSGVTGATIDGDGSIVLLVDVRDLVGSRQPARGAGLTTTRMTTAGLVQAVGSEVDDMRAQGGVATLERHATARPKVLVVEDSVGVRELQRAILESAGYDVTTAVDGTDGAARLQQEPVDLVLSDVEMPGMDGFTLTRTIRATRGWENVPVVIMTSRGDDADKRAGLDAGADAYLLKSEFDQHELIDTVRRLVGR